MGDPTVGRTNSPSPQPTTVPTLDDQIMEKLEFAAQRGDPKANLKMGDVEKFFKSLSPDDAKQLYERLKSNDGNDPVSKKFHTFEKGTVNNLMQVLGQQAGKTVAQAAPQSSAPPTQGPASPSTLKAEKNLQGAAMQAQLQKALVESDHDVIIDSNDRPVDKAKDIVEHNFMSPDLKKAKLQELMRTASPEEFKELLAASEKWDPKEAQIFNIALAESPDAMKRIAKELTPEDQLRAVNRTQQGLGGISDDSSIVDATLKKREEAFSAWMENTDVHTFKLAIDSADNPKAPDAYSTVGKKLMDAIPKSPKETKLLDKLSDKDQVKVLSHAIYMGKELSKQEARYLAVSLAQMGDSKDKNAAIDDLQNKGILSKAFAAMGDEFHISMLNGLSRENAKAIGDAYQHLAHAAELRKQVELSISYAEKAQHINGWIENHYK